MIASDHQRQYCAGQDRGNTRWSLPIACGRRGTVSGGTVPVQERGSRADGAAESLRCDRLAHGRGIRGHTEAQEAGLVPGLDRLYEGASRELAVADGPGAPSRRSGRGADRRVRCGSARSRGGGSSGKATTERQETEQREGRISRWRCGPRRGSAWRQRRKRRRPAGGGAGRRRRRRGTMCASQTAKSAGGQDQRHRHYASPELGPPREQAHRAPGCRRMRDCRRPRGRGGERQSTTRSLRGELRPATKSVQPWSPARRVTPQTPMAAMSSSPGSRRRLNMFKTSMSLSTAFGSRKN